MPTYSITPRGSHFLHSLSEKRGFSIEEGAFGEYRSSSRDSFLIDDDPVYLNLLSTMYLKGPMDLEDLEDNLYLPKGLLRILENLVKRGYLKRGRGRPPILKDLEPTDSTREGMKGIVVEVLGEDNWDEAYDTSIWITQEDLDRENKI